MRGDVDVEEVDRLPAVEDRRAFPHGPAVVVAGSGDDDGPVPLLLVSPGSCEVAGEILVVDLEDDLPVGLALADDHGRPPATGANVPAR